MFKQPKRITTYLFLVVFLLAIFTRFFRLDMPSDYVFDEVYHAFTAQEMVKGNVAAWEWWNDSPEQFAYEWTHPPLSKLLMGVGIGLFSWMPGNLERVPNLTDTTEAPFQSAQAQNGDNPFGWRFSVAVFSVGIVLCLYLLGKELFSQTVGLIAAFLATFDGLFFVMGRIGMNDTFFLFFQLLALLMFVRYLKTHSLHTKNSKFQISNDKLKGKKSSIFLLFTGIAQGLALSSKWSAVYGTVVLAFFYVVVVFVGGGKIGMIRGFRDIRGKTRLLFRSGLVLIVGLVFLVGIPVVVYLASYIPFFATNHTWTQFVELQQQMWWYHTNLDAVHSYQSPALSWPLMIRSVWYYVKYGDMTVSHIYALGNPFIWWSGIVAVIVAAVASIQHLVVNINKFKIAIFACVGRPVSLARLAAKRAGRQNTKSNTKTVFNQNTPQLLFLLFSYFTFFLPWVVSPRIMFLYHYFPSLSFLILLLAYWLSRIFDHGKQGKIAVLGYLVLIFATFVYFYPILAAVEIPNTWAKQYFWLASWK